MITRLVEALGDWRAAFTWIAALAFLPPMLVVLFVVRDRPEDLGLRPYGAEPNEATSAPRGLTLGESVRTGSFWALVVVIVLCGMPCYSFNKHVLVYLQDLGYPKVHAADLKSLFFAVSGCARVSFGYLADRFDTRRVVLAHTACIALAYPLILLVPTYPAVLYPCLVVLGIGYGGLLPSIPVMTLYLFGRAHLGSILGAYKIPYDAAAAGAPLLTAALYDRFGGYAVPERVNSAFAGLGLMVATLWLLRLPAASTAGAKTR